MTGTAPGDENDLVFDAEVPPELDGKRLDVACAQLFADWSRARLQNWIEAGRVSVDGEVVLKTRHPVAAGARLQLSAEELDESFRVEPQDLPIDVVHADRDLVVIDKPPGLTVHPGAGQRDGTLQNALLHHFPQTAAVPRAGIVHRLDKDTSGLMVVALNLKAHARLVADLQARTIRREYEALVQGELISGATIDLPIGRHPRDRLRMAVVEHGGRDAVTHYRIGERFSQFTRLSVRLQTGRTHQIRVHLAHVRHPIVGDPRARFRAARGTARICAPGPACTRARTRSSAWRQARDMDPRGAGRHAGVVRAAAPACAASNLTLTSCMRNGRRRRRFVQCRRGAPAASAAAPSPR
jgi:23S rRNA pseudouridine1911/1915/1917 synthase